MYLFRVFPPFDEWEPPYKYEIKGKRKWHLPGVDCPVCRESWGSVGLSYPAFDLSSLPNAKEYLKARCEPLEQWKRLQEALKPAVPEGTSLAPGASFGPLSGSATGRYGDFAWFGRWTLLLQKKTLDLLESAGIRSLLAAKTEMKFTAKNPPDLLELHIEPGAWLTPGARAKKACRGCGRRNYSKPKTIVIDRATVPPDRALFRLHDLPTHIICTQEFRDAVSYFDFSNIDFEDLDVM